MYSYKYESNTVLREDGVLGGLKAKNNTFYDLILG